MSKYEALRAEKIARNNALLKDLELETASSAITIKNRIDERPSKRRKVQKLEQLPSRSSARIASAPVRPKYNEDEQRDAARRRVPTKQPKLEIHSEEPEEPPQDIDDIRNAWMSWEPTAEPPSRDGNGTFHFDTDPHFLPNKSPEEMLHEGCFGGSYFRPIYSKRLKVTVEGDWRELPSSWLSNLKVEKFLTSPVYDPEVNKYGVSCGQSIEEWEANGWINHQFDVRGWFQWYIRYWLGRRCDDDNRQIQRWKKCVGETGRWRRALLKKYVQAGIRSINDEGLDETEGVSPAIHQTCLHWAFEIKQDVLDQWWDGS